ncbi:hypothetical protein T492DRAFT_583485, partial [Pavlovales sp. CCMP2436]
MRDPTSLGLRIFPDVDDFLILIRTHREALQARSLLERVLDSLGLIRHPDKRVWEPTQRLEHLGLEIDTSRSLFLIPPRKQHQLAGQARELLWAAASQRRLVSERLLSSFIGCAQSVHLACPATRFYLR